MPERLGTGSAAPDPRPDTPQVLPDFCSGETVLRVFVLVMVLALVALLLRGGEADLLSAIAPVFLFICWVAFSSLLVLCLLQRWVRRRGLFPQVVITTLVPVANTALVHLGAEHFEVADSSTRLQVIAVTALLSLIAMRYFHIVAAWQQETRAVARAREQALRARVRPHFLFNSMNTIAGLCRTDPARAEQVTLDLADLFRATFSTASRHSLAEELELVRAYLDIEQSRFGPRLQLEWDLAPAQELQFQVPALILQPLVENAIQHGIAPVPEGGRVRVQALREHGGIWIEIFNTTGPQTGRGTGTATDDVRARLRHAYGNRARLDIQRAAGSFKVRLNLPLADAREVEA
jgi:two-component system, LytTR family, sensor histidine kinase AlgZ